jgi:hypothetical protein
MAINRQEEEEIRNKRAKKWEKRFRKNERKAEQAIKCAMVTMPTNDIEKEIKADKNHEFQQEILAAVKVALKQKNHENPTCEYINSIIKDKLGVIRLGNDENALIMNARLNVGTKMEPNYIVLKCLLDTGATTSFLDTKKLEKHTQWLDKKRAKCNLALELANGSMDAIQNQFKGVVLTEKDTGKVIRMHKLYEMKLPKHIDVILGMDWHRQFKPKINWENNTWDYKIKDEEPGFFHPKESIPEIKEITPTSSKISWKQMKRIMRKTPELVQLVHVKDNSHNKVTEGRRLANATLTKKRLEAILQKHEKGETEAPKEKERDAGVRKLFLDQKETGYQCIDEVLLKSEKRFVMELTPEIISDMTVADDRTNFPNMSHKIDIRADAAKIPNRPYYRMSYEEQQECKRQIEKYLDSGMIRPSQSPYGSAVLFAPKKNGKLRFCVDYRPLNDITIKNAVQPPDTEDCLSQLSGANIFSTLDLAAGYHQLLIREEDKYKTAFNTKYGHYEWNVMCFGLTNAPATFVQALNSIFSGEAYRLNGNENLIKNYDPDQLKERKKNMLDDYICIYIDDIIIFSKTPEEHAKHIEEVMTRLTDFNFFVQSPKSFIAEESVEYLGHKVSRKGIQAMDDKVKIIKEWQEPKNVGDVRQFLGLCGYYRKFIQGYAATAKPLTDLTRKEKSDKNGNFIEGCYTKECH